MAFLCFLVPSPGQGPWSRFVFGGPGPDLYTYAPALNLYLPAWALNLYLFAPSPQFVFTKPGKLE